MKTTITSLLLTIAFWSGAALAAAPEAKGREAEVQKDIDSIVANCEKKKLPTEAEIECIEQGFLRFMGEEPQPGAR